MVAFEGWMASDQFVDARLGRVAKPLSAGSAKVYLSMFSKFTRYLLAQTDLVEAGGLGTLLLRLQPEQIQAFLVANQLEGKGIGLRYLRLLERLFDRLGTLQLTLANPARQLLLAKPIAAETSDDQKMFLTAEQQASVLAALQTLNSPLEGEGGREKTLRNQALVCLVLGAGLKVSEVLKLKLRHVNTMRHEDGALWLEVPKVGTGRKHHTCLMPFAVAHVLKWHAWRSQAGDLDRWLFANSRGEELHPATVYRQVAAVLEVAGVPKTLIKRRGARTLRNSFAINELARGTSEVVVGEYLGHRSERSTKHYSTLVRNKIREAETDQEKVN